MARPTGSCPPGRKPLLSDRETALGRRSFRPSPCRGRHPSSPRRRGGSNIHSYFWPMWLKYSFPLVAQILVPTWLKYSLTFTTGFGFRVIGVRVLVFFIRLGELILMPVKWARVHGNTGRYHKIWLIIRPDITKKPTISVSFFAGTNVPRYGLGEKIRTSGLLNPMQLSRNLESQETQGFQHCERSEKTVLTTD